MTSYGTQFQNVLQFFDRVERAGYTGNRQYDMDDLQFYQSAIVSSHNISTKDLKKISHYFTYLETCIPLNNLNL